MIQSTETETELEVKKKAVEQQSLKNKNYDCIKIILKQRFI